MGDKRAFPLVGKYNLIVVGIVFGIFYWMLEALIHVFFFGDGSYVKEFFVLDWETVQRKVPWGILLLFGGGFALAAGFGKTGLDQWIGSQLSAVGTLPLVLVVLIICVSITFLTELTSNTATTTMILPILAAIAVASAIHPLYLMVPAALSASFAFMLPSCSCGPCSPSAAAVTRGRFPPRAARPTASCATPRPF